MIRITLSIIFVSFLGRIPTYAVPYFMLGLVLISVLVAGLGIRRGYLYYYDIFNLTVFPTIFVIYITSPEVLPWMIHSWGPIMYLLLAVATILPSLLLRRPVACISWKKDSLPVPAVLLVLWGATFLLSSTMLWRGAPVRTPWLIIVMLTIPTRIALARELKLIWNASHRRGNIQQVRPGIELSSSFNRDAIVPTYDDLKQFLQLSEPEQHQQMQDWLDSIATAEEEQRQQRIRQLLLTTAQLNDVDRAKVTKVRTIVLARMPVEQIRDIVRSRYRAMQDLRDINEADRAVVMMMAQQMPGDVQETITKVSTKLRKEFSKRR